MLPKTPCFWKTPSLLGYVLLPVSFLYYIGFLLQKWLVSPVSFSVPVICVGNLTAGGSGKTPVAIALAKLLKSQGYRVVFLSRGYSSTCRTLTLVNPSRHRASQVGDEPLLLARVAPTFVCPDRRLALSYLSRHRLDFIITDDGLQDRSVRPALSLLVLDRNFMLGNGLLLPAGPLREPLSALLPRIQGVILRGDDPTHPLPTFSSIPVLSTSSCYPAASSLTGKTIVAFAGIGNPQQFFDSLKSMGCHLLSSVAFPDHYYYTRADIEKLVAMAGSKSAILITTEKDWIRLPEDLRTLVAVSPLELTWDDPDQLMRLIPALRK